MDRGSRCPVGNAAVGPVARVPHKLRAARVVAGVRRGLGKPRPASLKSQKVLLGPSLIQPGFTREAEQRVQLRVGGGGSGTLEIEERRESPTFPEQIREVQIAMGKHGRIFGE